MYRLASLYNDESSLTTGTLPQIYRLSPVVDVSGSTTASSTLNSTMTSASAGSGSSLESRMKKLEQRQTALMEKLGKFIQLADNSLATAGAGAAGKAKHGQVRPSNEKSTPCSAQTNVVLHANPASAPVGTLILINFLKANGSSIFVREYWHSSCKTPAPPGFIAKQRVAAIEPCHTQVNIVWRDVAQPSLVVGVSAAADICGDGNIAKFFCRHISPALASEGDLTQATETEHWLDTATQLQSGSSKEQKIVSKAVNTFLGKQAHLAGETPALSDFVLAAAYHSTNAAMPSNVKKWMERMRSMAAFDDALAMLPESSA